MQKKLKWLLENDTHIKKNWKGKEEEYKEKREKAKRNQASRGGTLHIGESIPTSEHKRRMVSFHNYVHYFSLLSHY